MRLLAIDPAARTGYAFGITGGKPRSSTINLPQGTDPDDVAHRLMALEGAMRDVIEGNRVEAIVVEDIFQLPADKFSRKQSRLLNGYRTMIDVAARKSGISHRRMIWATPGEWRKSFGTSTIPPEIRRSKQTDARRKYLKMAAFERARELGFDPRNEDEADALGLWCYGEVLLSQFESNERMPLFAASL